MQRQNVKLIVVEPYFSLKTPQSIASRIGGTVLVLAPSVGGVKEAADYIQLFDYNAATRRRFQAGDREIDDGQHLLEFLAAPAAAALVIAGVHAYLGLHVVEHGVIFVGLSLAQIASLSNDRRARTAVTAIPVALASTI